MPALARSPGPCGGVPRISAPPAGEGCSSRRVIRAGWRMGWRTATGSPILGGAGHSMSLFIRLVRALWIFGLIFMSYMLHLGLVRVFRRERRGTGREVSRVPEWLQARRERIDRKNARRLLHGMLRLRGVYIKL